jgi:O-succinylbenzoate synthase
MKIDAVEVYLVSMPLISPWRAAHGDEATIESVFVRLVCGESFGWGESSPLATPTYSPEWSRGVFLMVHGFLAPMLIGKRIDSGEELQRLLAPVKGNHFAKAALDLAWWDLQARMASMPLWKLLGGRRRVVEVGADFGVKDSIGELLQAIDEALQAGYKRVKLKFRPGWDLPMIRAVRKAFPEAVFHVDCNSAYHLEDLDMLRSLDEFELAMIEQPLAYDDLLDHAELQRQIRTRICLDESITSTARARQAAQIKACGWVNIKPGRVGGLTTAVQIQDLCLAAGIPCWVGGMLESSLGAHQCLALATLPNFLYPNDIFPSATYYRTDLCDPPVVLSGASQVTAPDTPGSGAEPNPARLKAQTLQRVIVRK